ncbi:hypothetical protein KUTeg_009414 [Tegillarca granosa]|uniref:Chitin-binding type-4 domain-containing protein n=1 Tax=Tegillarca granosa TaxID=220873 RepID=A0ABQ9F745_TEGGR|nr:hypothetical protein KUTeg_009414 [Tegillarca granosa]
MILIWTTILLLTMSSFCNGHGYLKEPPSRSSMWRYGFNTPTNYNDNQLFCGGFDVSKCGICGDRWDGSRDNEAGGIYATGIISRHYTEGQTMHVEVKLTKQHGGYFEFRICPNNNPSRRATQACLNRYLLRQPDGSTRYYPKGGSQTYSVQLMLPPGLTCTQCVIQWIWNTASNWGCEGGQCGRGFGHQEQFRGCADVLITSSGSHSNNNPAYPSNNRIRLYRMLTDQFHTS